MVDRPPVGFSTMSSGLRSATNYHRWLFELVCPHLGRRALECGTGNGIMTRYLAEADIDHVYTVDIDENCICALQKDMKSSKVTVGKCDMNGQDLETLFRNERIDTIIAFNVLEHLERDDQILHRLHQILLPGGKLLIFVPAFRFLYGGMDIAAGHYRRYTRGDLMKKLSAAGLFVSQIDYVNPLGFFGWLITGRILAVRDLNHGAVNTQIGLFDRYILPLSRRLQPITKRLLGQSIFAVAVKL